MTHHPDPASDPPTNADVRWAAHAFGLAPTLPPGTPTDVPTLLALLDDPDRFVVAHVQLTQVSGQLDELFPTYNGLPVDVRADGTVVVDTSVHAALRTRWHAWAAGDAPPAA